MSDFEDVKPYTQAELDQQAIWANEFDQWWENEGQYQRAGGGQYERSFAWWAWLNREQNQQAIIDNLKAQLNNMEACYIEKKKEVEDRQKRIDEYKKLTTSIRNEFDLWSDDSEFADVIEDQIENLEALRGES
ncbi:hypothetical protein [Acinetobacter lwoffii]|uniref:hypothetical protein n=1 Tax=Acinetobacter lwoffii TaxID=28090 RepID=UPI001443EE48|nr:hypothetical protein [Acinetobacter lwoffii]MCU4615605.1 hypothetical protein [Acinetobacter lwoffii]NKS45327.1 hypothetical protein [Acinetobacter lwoffii]